MRKKELEMRKGQAPANKIEAGRYFSRAIGHALDVLEILRQGNGTHSLTELTRMTALPKSSVFRILRTLEVTGYIERRIGDRYELSATMAGQVSNGQAHKVANVASPIVREVNREFRETVSVAYLFENHIEVILTVPSPERVQMSNVLGGIIPPHASSMGKSIVAYQPESRRDKLLSTYGIVQFTPKTLLEESMINQEFEKIREQGYSTDLEENAVGGCCFAAPIRSGGKVVAAISVSVPKMRCPNQERFIKAVVSAAETISSKIDQI